MRQLALLLVVFLSGCTTLGMKSPDYSYVIAGVDWPLTDLQSLVAYELPTGMRTTSANGREMYSKYFVLDGNKYKAAGEALNRYFAGVTVLGDHRPYDIEIYVTREKRIRQGAGYTYVEAGHDMMLARELEHKLKVELAKRRDGHNVVDDFRVF